MKIHQNLLLLFICFFSFYALQAQNKYINKRFTSPKSKSEFLRYLAKYHTKNGIAILDAESDIKNYTIYANGTTHEDMLENFGTVIHESCHGFNFNIGIDRMQKTGFQHQYQGYYISPSVKIAVPQLATYRSTVLNKVVPKSWQKKIFRYDTYVGDGSEVSSQVNGIYGMIDEFVAYYQGTKANIELQSYYESFCDYSNVECWTEYLTEPSSSLYAYYEFRLFIAWYLKHAKKNYPKVYQETMGNQALRVVYTLTDRLFANLQKDYFARRTSILEKLNMQSNQRVVVENGFLMIYEKDGSGASGKGAPDQTIDELIKLFTLEDLKLLQQFSMPAVTFQNYKQYLKN